MLKRRLTDFKAFVNYKRNFIIASGITKVRFKVNNKTGSTLGTIQKGAQG